MAKSIYLLCRLLVIGAVVGFTTAVVPSSLKKTSHGHLMLDYNWPVPDPSITQFPHESSCHYYYLMLSESDITIEKCPDGQRFDYVRHSCSDKEHVHCWSQHFGKIKHLVPKHKHFKCPYPWGKYPNIHNCSTYHLCLSGKSKLKKCAPFELFDKIERKCVAEINAVCADETDVVEHGYKCPKIWGSFTFPKDCSKYYECLQKKPSLRTCQRDRLFDENKNKCAPKELVDCGSRFNPYEKINTAIHVTSTVPTTNLDATLASAAISSDNSANTFQKETKSDIASTVKATPGSEDKYINETRSTLKEIQENQNIKSNTGEISTAPPAKIKSEVVESNPQETTVSGNATISNSVPEKSELRDEKANNASEVNDVSDSNEFIEVSASEKRETTEESITLYVDNRSVISKMETAAQKIANTVSGKPENKTQSLTEFSQGTTTKDPKLECPSEDPTCVIDIDGIMIKCTVANGLQPHPRDERRFLDCSDNMIHIKYCPAHFIFSSEENKCKWRFIMG